MQTRRDHAIFQQVIQDPLTQPFFFHPLAREVLSPAAAQGPGGFGNVSLVKQSDALLGVDLLLAVWFFLSALLPSRVWVWR